jgi:hypothetical protein
MHNKTQRPLACHKQSIRSTDKIVNANVIEPRLTLTTHVY